MSEQKVEEPKKKRSMVRDLLEVFTHNHLLSNKEASIALGIPEQTIRILRASDAFQASLAFEIEKHYGAAIRAVRVNTLVSANAALETTQRIMRDPAVNPSLKLDAAKVALEHFHKGEDRAAGKNNAQAQQPTNNVTINLSMQELHDAREAAITHGNTIELEPSDHAHAQVPRVGRQDILPPFRKEGVDV